MERESALKWPSTQSHRLSNCVFTVSQPHLVTIREWPWNQKVENKVLGRTLLPLGHLHGSSVPCGYHISGNGSPIRYHVRLTWSFSLCVLVCPGPAGESQQIKKKSPEFPFCCSKSFICSKQVICSTPDICLSLQLFSRLYPDLPLLNLNAMCSLNTCTY